MGKGSSFDSVDEFILDRWAPSRDVARAFKQTNKKMRRRFKKVGAEIAEEIAEQGYELSIDDRWAEFRAYRPEWCWPDGTPAVTAAVGGLFPAGFFRVEEDFAYACIYLQELGPGSQQEENRQFADKFYANLGGKPSNWLDRTDDENWTSPLYVSIARASNVERIELARDSKKLKTLTIQHLKQLFTYGEAITNTLAPLLKR